MDPKSFAIALLGVSVPIVAQSWQYVSSGNPPPMTVSSMAYDEARAVVVACIDNSPTSTLSTWLHDGTSWSPVGPALGYPAASQRRTQMCYDTLRRRLMLIGSWGALYAFDGQAWNPVPTPTVFPPVDSEIAATWDSGRNRIVAWVARSFANTWEWDGSNWIAFNPAPHPGELTGARMAYDPLRGVCVFCGGATINFGYGGTLEWNGMTSTWQPIAAFGRAGHGLTYDARLGRVVAFGGEFYVPTVPRITYDDVLAWNGTAWTQVTPTTPLRPTARTRAAIACDIGRGQLVLFGGAIVAPEAGHWELSLPNPAVVAQFGAGCGGSAGVPGLGLHQGRVPWLGSTLQLGLSNVANPLLHAEILGLSRTQWGTQSLPAPLDFLGMTGCQLHVSPDLVLPVAQTPLVNLSIPNQPGLLGMTLYGQSLLLDVPANPLGVTASNACALRIGVP